MKTVPKILYEDDWMLAVDKPTGVFSVPANFIPEFKTIQGITRQWALDKGYKPYLLNRLDKDTSGIILFGKFPRDREKLEGIFKDPSTEKTYHALVKGMPRLSEGTIKFSLDARGIEKKIPAISHYKIIKKQGLTSIVEVKIETGRYHQIRKHMAMIGHPLVLDKDYGDRRFNQNYMRLTKGKGEYLLRCVEFKFMHPFTQQKTIIQA